MHKETITYIDFDGTERTEDHYFNLTKTELVKMEMGVTGGYVKMMQDIIAAQDIPKIMGSIEDIIRKSYGKKSPDGRRFEKSDAISKEFMETNAYDELLFKFLEDEDYFVNFVKSIVPNNLSIPEVLPETGNV